MSRTVAAIAIISIATLAARAQSLDPSPIHGRVLAADSGDPLPHARVVLFNDELSVSSVFSDRDGRFALPLSPTGRYRVSVTKPGYTTATIFRADATRTDGVDVRLPRSCAISGRVVDAFGEPVVGVPVSANLRGRGNEAGPVVKTVQTDDLGEYRLGGLAEGSFVVTVNVMQMDSQGNATRTPTYYPGVPAFADAEVISLRAGDQRASLDFTGVSNGPTFFTVSGQITQAGQTIQAAEIRLLPPTPLSGAPAAETGTGTIRGRVTRSDGVPLSRAAVTTMLQVNRTSGVRLDVLRSAFTEEDGRFEFSGLPGGTYRIIANKHGYMGMAYGGRLSSDPGMSIALGANESRSVDIVLPRYSSMTGHIVDEFGDAVEGIQIDVAQIRFQAGRRRLVGVDGAVGETNDLGRYRVSGMQPGQYVVRAVVGQVTPFHPTPDLPGYTTTYFPGTPNAAEAQLVSVGISQDLAGVDLALEQVPTALITGRRLASNGDPLGGLLVLVPSYRSGAIITPPVGARTYPDGRFEFPNVPPGDYVIQADTGRRNPFREGEFASRFVTVNGSDVTDVLLQASSGSTISGHVRSAGDEPPAARPSVVAARADPDRTPLQNGSIAHGDVQSDLTFQLSGIHGPRRLDLDRPPAGWALKAVLVNGIDVTDTPLPFGSTEQSLSDVEVVVTNRLTELTGTVLDARGNAVKGCAIVVFSSDPDRWYSGSRYLQRSVGDGTCGFRFSGLPPGDYLISAVARPRAAADAYGDDSWQDPEWLQSITPGASRVTLAEEQKLWVNLKLTAR